MMQSFSLSSNCATWFKTQRVKLESLACMTVAGSLSKTCQLSAEEALVAMMRSTRNTKIPHANISTFRHVGPEESLMQMVALLSACTCIVPNKPRGHLRTSWSSQETGFESSGPQVKSAIVVAMTTQLSGYPKNEGSTSEEAIQAIQAR